MRSFTVYDGLLATIVTEDEEFHLVEAMRRSGGSFASNLAKAWAVADSGNRTKLRREFGDLLLRYKAFLPPGKEVS